MFWELPTNFLGKKKSVYVLVIIFFLIGEIALLEGLTVVYKSNIDLFFYVIGSSHENEVGLEITVFSISISPGEKARKKTTAEVSNL